MYKLQSTSILRLYDGACIPQDPANVDYAAYLAWIAAGNTPEPADVPDPKIAIQAQIDTLEAQQLLPRITREFMLSAAEAQAKAAGVDPMTNVGYAKLKEFDTQIAGLRGQL
jgi:hypothetical protein